MEVIARRKNGLLFLFGAITLLGAIFTVLAVQGVFSDETEVKFFVGGLLMLIFGSILCIKVLRTPKIIIQYDGEYLFLREGKFHITQLSNVKYRLAHVRGVHHRWGELILQLNGKEIVYNNVADVEYVHSRLLALRLAANKE